MPTQANLFPWIDQRFFDENGDPASGYKVYTYIAGSSTPAPTWPDKDLGGSPNSNPIIADSAGRIDMWGSPDYRYKIVLKTASDVTVKTWDYVELALVEGDDLQRVETADTDSVSLVGEGTVANPLNATVNISDLSLNALSITTGGITSGGLYAPCLDVETAAAQTVAGAVQWNATQTMAAGLDISAGLLTVQALATEGAAEYVTVDAAGTFGKTVLDLSEYLSKTDTGAQSVAGPVTWAGLQTMDAGITAQYKSGAIVLSKVQATGSTTGSVSIGAYNASGVLRGSLTVDGGSIGAVELSTNDAANSEKALLQLNDGGAHNTPQVVISTKGTTGATSNTIVMSDYQPNIDIKSYVSGAIRARMKIDGNNSRVELANGAFRLTPLATGGAAQYLTVDTNGDLSSTDAPDAVYGPFYYGAVEQSADVQVSSDGATITLTIEQVGGGDLDYFFSDGTYTLDCTPLGTASVTLTAGTDTNPTLNYVYLLQSTKALTVSTTGWPETVEYSPICTAVVPSAAYVASGGLYKLHLWTDHISDTVTNQGHLQHINYWIRNQPATWHNGVAFTTTPAVGGGTAATVHWATTAGEVLQLHETEIPARDSSTGSDLHVINDSVTPYREMTGFVRSQLTLDASGGSLSGNYYTVVIWGVASSETGYQETMLNLPTGSYNNSASAIADGSGYAVYAIPQEYTGTGYLIAAVTLRDVTGGGGSLEVMAVKDLRGGVITPSSAGGTATWGNITGTLSSQTDLQSALDDKLSLTATGTQTTASNLDFSAGWLKVGLGAAPAVNLIGQNAAGHLVDGDALVTMQFAYDNSSFILTDATNVAVTIQRGSAADSDLVFRTKDGLGNTQFSVTGAGDTRVHANTASTTFTDGALIVDGGMGVGGAINLGGQFKNFNVVDATSTTTGSMQTLGGMGIAKALWVGGLLRTTDTTASTSTTTGALVVTGGVGIGGALFVNGKITTNNVFKGVFPAASALGTSITKNCAIDSGGNIVQGALDDKSAVLISPTASEDRTCFQTRFAITMRELRVVLVGTSSPSVTFQVYHDTSRSAAGNALFSSAQTCTATSTGTTYSTFADGTIPASSWVWIETSATAGTVNEMALNFYFEQD